MKPETKITGKDVSITEPLTHGDLTWGRRFRPKSPLERYLLRKRPSAFPEIGAITCIAVVEMNLREIISTELLFDPHNPSIVFCNTDLERALRMRLIHLGEIKQMVRPQLVKFDDKLLDVPFPEEAVIPVFPVIEKIEGVIGSMDIRSRFTLVPLETDIPPERSFWVRAGFGVLLHQAMNMQKDSYTWKEMTEGVAKYILQRKSIFFDSRHPLIVYCGTDVLGAVFNVHAFHRCQMRDLIKMQLIPIDERLVLEGNNTVTQRVGAIWEPHNRFNHWGSVPYDNTLRRSLREEEDTSESDEE